MKYWVTRSNSRHMTDSVICCHLQGGRVEVGAPTGRWQMVVVYRGKHDPLDLTYLAALQHLMPEFEELNVDVVAVSSDTRNKACSFVDDLRGAVLAVSPDTKAGRIHFKVRLGSPWHGGIARLLRCVGHSCVWVRQKGCTGSLALAVS